MHPKKHLWDSFHRDDLLPRYVLKGWENEARFHPNGQQGGRVTVASEMGLCGAEAGRKGDVDLGGVKDNSHGTSKADFVFWTTAAGQSEGGG